MDWTGVSIDLHRKDHVRTGYERRGHTELRPPRTSGSSRAGRTCRPDRTARAKRELEGRLRLAGVQVADRIALASTVEVSVRSSDGALLSIIGLGRVFDRNRKRECRHPSLSTSTLKPSGIGGEREHRLIAGAAQAAERTKTLVQRLLAFVHRAGGRRNEGR